MEIKTNKSREVRSTRAVPPPDKARSRKKSSQKLGNGLMAGRRFVAALKFLAKAGSLVLVVVLTLSVFVYAFNSDTFNLRAVRIHGCKELDAPKLESIIRREFPANILRIDLRRVQQRLEKETWAKRVELRRVLPSDLIVYVQERVPSVTLEMHGELMIADGEGTLLGPYAPRFGKLDIPVFKGVLGEEPETYQLYQEENAARIQQGLAMLSEIASGSPQYTKIISEVDISDRSNLKLLLVDDTAELYLGDTDYLKRFQKFVNNPAEYQKLKSQHSEIDVIELRYDHQIIYRLKKSEPTSKNAKFEEPRRKNR